MLPRDYTAQEKLVAQVLTEMGLRYEQQAPVGSSYTVDFLLPSEGIVIEADGILGHLSKADRKRDVELIKLGVDRVIHLKETTRDSIRQTLENKLRCQE